MCVFFLFYFFKRKERFSYFTSFTTNCEVYVPKWLDLGVGEEWMQAKKTGREKGKVTLKVTLPLGMSRLRIQ
jgi:hypothetical protein